MSKFSSMPWTADDIAKLKDMAGRYPAAEIAAEIGRGPSATRVKAHLLKVSLRVRRAQPNLEWPPGAEMRPATSHNSAHRSPRQ
jgi:hypothetical protein